MAGRKPISNIVEPSALLPVELYTISHSPQFTRGAKREIRDNYGNLLYSSRQMRMHVGGTFTKDQAKIIISEMKSDGIKNIKLTKTNLNLPNKCPSCKNNGSPSIYKGKGTLRVGDKHNEKNRDELRLIYSHSVTKPKTCFVGTVLLDSPVVQIKLKTGLPIDSLGFKNRVGTYPLKSSK